MAAAASPAPKRRKITSTCTPEMDQCTHVLEIDGYSRFHDGLGAGRHVCSATFSVGSHDWQISYYPDGWIGEELRGYASVYLNLSSKPCPGTMVSGFVSFSLVNPSNGQSKYMSPANSIRIRHTVSDLNHNTSYSWGCGKFIRRSELEVSPYLRGDRLAIVCNVSVLVGTQVSSSEPETETMCEIQVPPSDLSKNLGKLLEAEEGVDVTFKVKGEVFHAHKIVLAMRSPVFKAELYGLVGTKNRDGIITIEDTEPSVFKALLHFIYTDSLPANDDLGGDDNGETVKHLLVAADRYAMERMRLICESILCKKLDIENAADTLVLADQHYCRELKDACIRFINSRNRIKDVIASQGYEHLKKACPSIVMDLLEEAARSSA